MDSIRIFIVYGLIFAGIIAVMFFAGRYIRRVPRNIAKKVSNISFAAVIVSGILLYVLHNAVFVYIFLASLVCFFLFLNYKDEGA